MKVVHRISCLCLLAAALVTGSADAHAAGGGELVLKTGDLAPPFSMRDLAGNNFALGDFVGSEATTPKKAVFIVFFVIFVAFPWLSALPTPRVSGPVRLPMPGR